MGKDKSMIAKFTETMKGLADSAADALKAKRSQKADDHSDDEMPLAAEGLISDPLLVPPAAVQSVRRRKRSAKTSAARRRLRTTKEKSNARSNHKASASTSKSKSRTRVKTSKAKSAKATATGRASAKRSAKTVRRGPRK